MTAYCIIGFARPTEQKARERNRVKERSERETATCSIDIVIVSIFIRYCYTWTSCETTSSPSGLVTHKCTSNTIPMRVNGCCFLLCMCAIIIFFFGWYSYGRQIPWIVLIFRMFFLLWIGDKPKRLAYCAIDYCGHWWGTWYCLFSKIYCMAICWKRKLNISTASIEPNKSIASIRGYTLKFTIQQQSNQEITPDYIEILLKGFAVIAVIKAFRWRLFQFFF